LCTNCKVLSFLVIMTACSFGLNEEESVRVTEQQ
jgi:hypothetical protein